MILKKVKSYFLDTSGTDRYLITYADLITLLLGLFVILYATAQVDSEKYKEFSAAFSDYFKVKDSKFLQGGDGILQGHREGVPEAILPPASAKSIEDIIDETKILLKDYMDTESLTLRYDDGGVTLVLSEALLFQSAKADIEKSGQMMLDTLAKILEGMQFQISIDGHTDADPIRTFQYESNWHLSVARATNIAYALISKGVPEYNLVIRGFGSQRPIDENITPQGKAKNRRVEIGISERTHNMGREPEINSEY